MTEPELIIQQASRNARDGYWRRWMTAGLIVTVLGLTVFFVFWQVDRGEMKTDIKNATDRANDNGEDARALADQVMKLGEKPVVMPPPPPPSNETTNPVASTEAIRRQVNEYFADNPQPRPPSVTQVTRLVEKVYKENPPARGARGPRPTPTQVASAVAAYCGTERCTGDDGTDGVDGSPGPGPTDEQVFAAVAAYCAQRDECSGRDGVDGEKGEPGKPPFSWTWTDPGLLPGPEDDVTRECVRDNEDDDMPTYQCNPA